ncbi:hypothetical protein [Halapricum hydrolyticum]|uniref:hypothetical protein n=1 Tax=Halapricum hydrolyticum TaxID=2979991 RepID=UPI0028F6F392|nr:hypothetical protein [Halapricum hydrolyticum]
MTDIRAATESLLGDKPDLEDRLEDLLAVSAYAWVFLVLGIVQARFAGQLAIFVAVFSGLGFVHLAAWVELTASPDLFGETWGEPLGADGEIPLVARENATKLEVGSEGTDSDLTGLAIEDDFAGKLYDAPLSGPDAIYVHRGGTFTTEVRDTDDEVRAYRVIPDAEERVRIKRRDTGQTPLARYVANIAEETRAQVAALDSADDDDNDDTENGQSGDGAENAVRGLAAALGAVAEAADRAAEWAAAGGTDQQFDAVATCLERVSSRLSEARDDIPAELARATDNRLEQANRRSEQANNPGSAETADVMHQLLPRRVANTGDK